MCVCVYVCFVCVCVWFAVVLVSLEKCVYVCVCVCVCVCVPNNATAFVVTVPDENQCKPASLIAACCLGCCPFVTSIVCVCGVVLVCLLTIVCVCACVGLFAIVGVLACRGSLLVLDWPTMPASHTTTLWTCAGIFHRNDES